MPLFGVNMAVPMKDNRESQIYFLSSTENVLPENGNKKYVILKTFELILSTCSLVLFAYSVKATENKIEDMLICASLGALIFYPLLFILLSINVKRRPLYLMIINISAFLIMFAIGGGIMSTWWSTENIFNETEKKHTIKLIASTAAIINGLFYMVESLILSLEIRGFFYSR